MKVLDANKHGIGYEKHPCTIGDLLDVCEIHNGDNEKSSLLITGISSDSRKIKNGDLFLAVRGIKNDGSNYIDDAIKLGASAIFLESDEDFFSKKYKEKEVFFIPNLSEKISAIADKFYSHPSRQLSVIGITGTNGKTSCAHMIASVANKIGMCGSVIGTLGYGIYDGSNYEMTRTGFTTPDAIKIQECLVHLLESASDTVAVEVSSHALSLNRVDAVNFNVAVFTNLSRDHLDFHQTMANYAEAKRKLFSLPDIETAVINIDDDLGERLASEFSDKFNLITYSTYNHNADIYATDKEFFFDSIKTKIVTPFGVREITVPLLGEFNISNILASLASLLALGEEFETVVPAFEKIKPIKGRMEVIPQKNKSFPIVVVDYAHTPVALEKALTSLRPHVGGKLWCIFGCGGERDQGKRSEMARIAKKLSDEVIITSDNPRKEPINQIIDDILIGIDEMKNVYVEIDRSDAISFAIKTAELNDIILIAGKGHEDYQIIGDKRVFHSDILFVERFFEGCES
jgi:UDP-N-acetylmuramoyl-L-alanyl-D-glutamate--2,6-diaminopimelate ligase